MQTVLLLFGGESSEHDVSVSSARNVSQAIDTKKFTMIYGYIDREGKWFLVDQINDTPPDDAKQLLPILGQQSFSVKGTDTRINPDVILPILHGANGEDGAIQALAQLLHIPIVGCDMNASAVAMNKYVTKQIAMANGIRVVPFTIHNVADATPRYELVADKLGETLFVKPASSGSSVGVHKVTNQAELEAALTDSHLYDAVVLIEKGIDARELEVAILGNYPNIESSEVSEVKPDREFYSFESKYDESSASEVVIPAEISPEVATDLRRTAEQVFRLIGGSGLARIDFFIDKENQDVYLNEVNTIPGFTNISVYPKAWEHAGVSYGALIERLIQLALER
ncbi:MAG TPA: D-alanine--D-alanine ligase family protein [Candidatus Microsaccharimonas sp.]|jgi:D-alanine-D-alanine ligase